jgi:hypothetical protein
MDCPACSNHISPKPYFEIGYEFSCPQCGAKLRVSSAEPAECEIKED